MSEFQQDNSSWLPQGAAQSDTARPWENQPLDPNVAAQYASNGQMGGFQNQTGYVVYHHQGYDVYADFLNNQGFPMSLSDQVKHRRSRYGCFTCRSRRVKCDETHPVCERCRKSNRDCVYPRPQDISGSSTKEIKVKAKTEGGQSATKESESKEQRSSESSDLHSLSDTKSLSPSSPVSADVWQRRSSRSKHVKDKSRPPAYQERRSYSPLSAKHRINVEGNRLSNPMLQYYLDYHRASISHHHYGFIRDDGDFIHTFIPSRALQYPPLLYALVAFCAYIHAMSRDEGAELKDFLPYYSEAMVRLRESLKTQAPDLDTLLAILQLALLEEFLGDWLNVLSHQQAAFKLLTTLFTPETITVDQDHNKVLQWYTRFDLFNGFMSGRAPSLPREWFNAQVVFWEKIAFQNPTLLGPKYEERNASVRLIGLDIATLFQRISQGLLSLEDIKLEDANIRKQLQSWHDNFDPVLFDAGRAIRTALRLDESVPDHEDAAAAEEGLLFYTGDLRTTNYVWANTWPMELMFDHQMAVALQKPPSTDLIKRAISILKLYEMIERIDFTPGRTLGAIAPLGVAAIFLRNQPEMVMWCRKKLAAMESQGYTFPSTFRRRMSDAWGIDVTRWWLPDNEGFKPIVQAIREFVDGRANSADDKVHEDLKNLSGIFNALKLNPNDPATSPNTETPQGSEANSSSIMTDSPTEDIQSHAQSDSVSPSPLSQIPEIPGSEGDESVLSSEHPSKRPQDQSRDYEPPEADVSPQMDEKPPQPSAS